MKDTKHNILPSVKYEAEKLFSAVKEKNAAASKERKHQKELDCLMADVYEGKRGALEHSFDYNDNKVTVEIKYDQGVRDIIDINKLYDLVDLETFLQIVTASKSAVEKHCGKNISNLVVGSKLSDWKTSVKEKK